MAMVIYNGHNLQNISLKISEEYKNLIIKIKAFSKIKLSHLLIRKFLISIKLPR
jgi:hypothetical protein